MANRTRTNPATVRADSAAPADELCAALDDTDADVQRATEIRLRAALGAIRKIKDLPWSEERADEMQCIAEDALIADGMAEDTTPPTAMQLLEDWQAAHRDRDATVELRGYWSAGTCRVTLLPHAADEYARKIVVERESREQAIRIALERWEANCELGRREEVELEAHWERVDAERERQRNVG